MKFKFNKTASQKGKIYHSLTHIYQMNEKANTIKERKLHQTIIPGFLHIHDAISDGLYLI